MPIRILISLLVLQQSPVSQPGVHYRISRLYATPEKVDPSLESAARSSSAFGARYAALMVQVHRALARGSGFEALHRAILELSTQGAPSGAAEHLRALAASLKRAVHCGTCKGGKVACSRCQGKKKIDMTCPTCEGKGRLKAPGQANDRVVTQRCNTCHAQGTLKGVACPECPYDALVKCPDCQGRIWKERKCAEKDCRAGRVPCAECKGKLEKEVTCPVCNGVGRTKAPGSAGEYETNQRCNNCNTKGTVTQKGCAACDHLGHLACPSCRDGAKSGAASLSDILSAESCQVCHGSGWPQGEKGEACIQCVGLGVCIKPAADPAKILDGTNRAGSPVR